MSYNNSVEMFEELPDYGHDPDSAEECRHSLLLLSLLDCSYEF